MIARWKMFSIIYYVLQKIEHGLKDNEKGWVYTQEEVEKQMAKWPKNSLVL